MDAHFWTHHLKLQRADEHLRRLHEDIAAFLKNEPDTIHEYFELRNDKWWYVVAHKGLWADPRWGIIVGDIAHNLRSILDQIVWTVVVDIAGSTPAPNAAFPLLNQPRDWKRQVVRTRRASDDRTSPLLGMPDKAIALVESFQPYNRGNEALGRLRWLNNTDKHQLVHPSAIVSADKIPGVTYKRPDGSLGASSEVIYEVGKALEGDTEIEVLRARMPEGFDESRFDYVAADFLPVDVAFGKRKFVYRDLVNIRDRIEQVLYVFSTTRF